MTEQDHSFRYRDPETGNETVVALSSREAAALLSTCKRAKRAGRDGRVIHDGVLPTHWSGMPEGVSEDGTPIERAPGMARYTGSGADPNDDHEREDDDDER